MRRRSRAYAMAIVLLVSVLLSLAISSMFFALSAATKMTGKHLAARRAQYICDGVVSLATSELRKATTPPSPTGRSSFVRPFGPTPSIAELNLALEPLRRGVRGDGVVIDELRVEAGGGDRIAVTPSGGFAGLEVKISDMNLRVGMSAPDAPPCTARQVLPLASISLFQLPAFSFADLSVQRPSRGAFSLPGRRGYVWAKGIADVDPTLLELEARSAADARLAPPAPPAPVRPVPTDFKFWTQLPNTGFPVDTPPERAGARAAFTADIRIIDGEWYLRDPADESAWPGQRIWSDHPCSDPRVADGCSNVVGSGDPDWARDVAKRRLYSRYERNRDGFLDGGIVFGGGAGVVSYGSVAGAGAPDSTVPAAVFSSAICAAPTTFDSFRNCVGAAAKNGPRGAIADAARGGFVDPGLGPKLPINLDVGQLGAALATRTNGELGSFLCLPRTPDDRSCRVFNGIVYVSASHGTPALAAPTTVAPVAAGPGGGQKLPWALCGSLSRDQTSLDGSEKPGFFDSTVMTGCEEGDYARIDAVRLLRADNLAPFALTGLTIITDLPLYVEDHVNLGGAGTRVALVGDRITVLSSNYSDRFAPLAGFASFPRPRSTPNMRVNASLFTGSPDADITHVVRVIEDSIDVAVTGAIAIGWISPDLRTPGQFTWSYPEQLYGAAATSQPPGAPRGSFVMPGGRL